MEIIFNEQFNLITNISRALKTEYIIFNMNNTYGLTIEEYGIYRVIDSNPFNMIDNNLIIFKSSDINEISKVNKKSKLDIILNNINGKYHIKCDDIDIEQICLDYSNTGIINKFFSDISIINNMCNNEPIYIDNELRKNSNFEEILSYKVNDGLGLFIVDKFILSIYSGLLSINKPDKVELLIYPFDKASFLSCFVIDKKKFKLITYIRYRYLV